MLLPHGTIVALVDGSGMELFRNGGNEAHPVLMEMPKPALNGQDNHSSAHIHSSAGNHADTLVDEAALASAAVNYLNHNVLDHKIKHLVVIAPPRTLGEMRPHYHKQLEAILVGELAKELKGAKGERIIEALRAK
jgi:protein required for attachment to host cells